MSPLRGWCWATPLNTLFLRMEGLVRQQAARTGRATGTSVGDPGACKDWIWRSRLYICGVGELLNSLGLGVFCGRSLKHGHLNSFSLFLTSPLQSREACFAAERPKESQQTQIETDCIDRGWKLNWTLFVTKVALYAALVFLYTSESSSSLPAVRLSFFICKENSSSL